MRANIPFGRVLGYLMNTFGKATALSSNHKEMLPEKLEKNKKKSLKLMTTQLQVLLQRHEWHRGRQHTDLQQNNSRPVVD